MLSGDRTPPGYLSIAETCAALNISRSKLYATHFVNGDLRREHDGRRIVVDAQAVERLKRRLKFPSVEDPLLRSILVRAAMIARRSPLPDSVAVRQLYGALASAARSLEPSHTPTPNQEDA